MSEIPSALVLFAAIAAGAVAGSLFATLRSLRRRHWLRTAAGTTALLPTLLLVALAGLLLLNAWGYHALTHEEVAAVVETRPVGPQRFTAAFRFPDGSQAEFQLAGDELYVDARILKWKYWANLIGLYTSYELDRVAGRYRALADERDKPRTVHPLADDLPVDAFTLRQRFPQLAFLLDAEYGSATFVPANAVARYEIRVSTTGLLARRIAPEPK